MLEHLQIKYNTLQHRSLLLIHHDPESEVATETVQVSSANLGELWSAFLDAVLDPGHHGVKNLFLTPDIELIAGNYIDQLIGRQQHEFFTFHDL